MKKFLLSLLFVFGFANAKIIEYHGDSTVYGTSMVGGVYVNQVAFPVPVVLQGMIDARCGVGMHTVVNKGIGGSSGRSALTTGIYAGQTFGQYMQTSPADIVIANWQINDVFIPNNSQWLAAYDHTQASRIVKSLGKIYIAETAQPLNYSAGHNSLVQAYASALVIVGGIENYSVIDQWNGINIGFPYWNYHLPDGIHPAQSIYFYKALITFNFLKSKGYLC